MGLEFFRKKLEVSLSHIILSLTWLRYSMPLNFDELWSVVSTGLFLYSINHDHAMTYHFTSAVVAVLSSELSASSSTSWSDCTPPGRFC